MGGGKANTHLQTIAVAGEHVVPLVPSALWVTHRWSSLKVPHTRARSIGIICLVLSTLPPEHVSLPRLEVAPVVRTEPFEASHAPVPFHGAVLLVDAHHPSGRGRCERGPRACPISHSGLPDVGDAVGGTEVTAVASPHLSRFEKERLVVCGCVDG